MYKCILILCRVLVLCSNTVPKFDKLWKERIRKDILNQFEEPFSNFFQTDTCKWSTIVLHTAISVVLFEPFLLNLLSFGAVSKYLKICLISSRVTSLPGSSTCPRVRRNTIITIRHLDNYLWQLKPRADISEIQKQWRIHGSIVRRPPWSKFFHFHAVFSKTFAK